MYGASTYVPVHHVEHGISAAARVGGARARRSAGCAARRARDRRLRIAAITRVGRHGGIGCIRLGVLSRRRIGRRRDRAVLLRDGGLGARRCVDEQRASIGQLPRPSAVAAAAAVDVRVRADTHLARRHCVTRDVLAVGIERDLHRQRGVIDEREDPSRDDAAEVAVARFALLDGLVEGGDDDHRCLTRVVVRRHHERPDARRTRRRRALRRRRREDVGSDPRLRDRRVGADDDRDAVQILAVAAVRHVERHLGRGPARADRDEQRQGARDRERKPLRSTHRTNVAQKSGANAVHPR